MSGNARPDDRPAPRSRLDLDGAAEERDTLSHAVQAEPGRFTESPSHVEADTVVANHQLQCGSIALHRHVDLFRASVSRHVRQRFLKDAIRGGRCQRRQSWRVHIANGKVDRRFERAGVVEHVPARGCREPHVVQNGGMQSAGKASNVVHRLCRNVP